MENPLNGVSLCSVVTFTLLEEFLQLKRSFELFHGASLQWHVRCDDESLAKLTAIDLISTVSFTKHRSERPEDGSPAFMTLMREKMNAIDDAWCQGADSVLYLDADILITSRLLDTFCPKDTDIILSPNYYPLPHKYLRSVHGFYNGGFVFTRSREFHRWWATEVDLNPVAWADQLSLNRASSCFTVAEMSEKANIGFWRYERRPEYENIPSDVTFLHVHLYQPLSSRRQWLDKSFALHCVRFLRQSTIQAHRELLEDILFHDRAQWYRASLQL